MLQYGNINHSEYNKQQQQQRTTHTPEQIACAEEQEMCVWGMWLWLCVCDVAWLWDVGVGCVMWCGCGVCDVV